MGTYIAYFVDPEGWASTMLQNGTTQEYINAMNNAAAWWVLVIMIAGTALIAWLSGLVGCKLLRKQFEKAGITARPVKHEKENGIYVLIRGQKCFC